MSIIYKSLSLGHPCSTKTSLSINKWSRDRFSLNVHFVETRGRKEVEKPASNVYLFTRHKQTRQLQDVDDIFQSIARLMFTVLQ